FTGNLALTVSPEYPSGGLEPGEATNATISLRAPAPSGGTVVHLTASPAGELQVPPSVTIPAGATSTSFVATALDAPIRAYALCTVTGTDGSDSASFTVAVSNPDWTPHCPSKAPCN